MDAELKKRSKMFFIIVPCVAFVYAAIAYHKGHFLRAEIVGGIGAAIVLLRLLLPALAETFFRLYHLLISKLGDLITRVFMTVFFYVIFTPYGLILKLIQGDLLHRKLGPEKSSYWITRPSNADSYKDCERPF